MVTERMAMRTLTRDLGFPIFDVTRATLAMSELVRNHIEHAGRGTVTLQGCYRAAGRHGHLGAIVIATDDDLDMCSPLPDAMPDRWICVSLLRRMSPSISVAVRSEATVVTMPIWPTHDPGVRQ